MTHTDHHHDAFHDLANAVLSDIATLREGSFEPVSDDEVCAIGDLLRERLDPLKIATHPQFSHRAVPTNAIVVSDDGQMWHEKVLSYKFIGVYADSGQVLYLEANQLPEKEPA